jgi:hypothetical protein
VLHVDSPPRPRTFSICCLNKCPSTSFNSSQRFLQWGASYSAVGGLCRFGLCPRIHHEWVVSDIDSFFYSCSIQSKGPVIFLSLFEDTVCPVRPPAFVIPGNGFNWVNVCLLYVFAGFFGIHGWPFSHVLTWMCFCLFFAIDRSLRSVDLFTKSLVNGIGRLSLFDCRFSIAAILVCIRRVALLVMFAALIIYWELCPYMLLFSRSQSLYDTLS